MLTIATEGGQLTRDFERSRQMRREAGGQV
jgi:hypothetical protein